MRQKDRWGDKETNRNSETFTRRKKNCEPAPRTVRELKLLFGVELFVADELHSQQCRHDAAAFRGATTRKSLRQRMRLLLGLLHNRSDDERRISSEREELKQVRNSNRARFQDEEHEENGAHLRHEEIGQHRGKAEQSKTCKRSNEQRRKQTLE